MWSQPLTNGDVDAAEASRADLSTRGSRASGPSSRLSTRAREPAFSLACSTDAAAHAQAADQAALAEMSEAIAQRIALLESIAGIDTRSRPRLRLVLLPSR